MQGRQMDSGMPEAKWHPSTAKGKGWHGYLDGWQTEKQLEGSNPSRSMVRWLVMEVQELEYTEIC